MSWWVVFQLYNWIAIRTETPDYFRLTDQAFFAQSMSYQQMSLTHPDTLLLDAALFQATNEARRQAGLPVLLYDFSLYRSASLHAESMIDKQFYGHENFYSLADRTAFNRIQKQTRRFNWTAENIGQYQTIDTPEWFGVRRNKRTGQYEYLNSQTKELYQPYTYAAFARYAVQQWLHSPHHRANLLNPMFTHVGCAARLSLNPFLEQHAPYSRLVQNFAGNATPIQASK
ncbi:CAP domain-containing protein [Spirosoma sp. SC4-14]|uniref:CAP domain-containing protein n=1 Tax=Spirosoma sp. SC4-14 TaxID=3128900 RepID=UPI0030CCC32E